MPHYHLPRLHRLLLAKGALDGAEVRDLADTLRPRLRRARDRVAAQGRAMSAPAIGDDLVLHHYAGSPFSEKVRLVLGMKGMRWRSVTVPVMLPKPDVVALTGGYRRTPFLQIGADIYCDTALMCRVIDRLAPEPPLYPESTRGLATIVAQWADQALFWTAVPFTMQPAGVAHIFAGVPPEAVKAFGADRAAMSPALRRAPLHDQAARTLTTTSTGSSSCSPTAGRSCSARWPAIADFSVGAVDLVRAPRAAGRGASREPIARLLALVRAHGRVRPRHARADDERRGDRAGRSGTASFARLRGRRRRRASQPGTRSRVNAADYAPTRWSAAWSASTPTRRRRAHDERAGTVHVHFPRVGFQVKAIKKDPP